MSRPGERASQPASLAANNRYSMLARARTSKCTRVDVWCFFFGKQGPVFCREEEEEGGEKAKLHTSLSSLICESHAPVTTPHATTHRGGEKRKKKKGHAFRSTSSRRLNGEDGRRRATRATLTTAVLPVHHTPKPCRSLQN